jgi:uncharacterized membrane protein YkoI
MRRLSRFAVSILTALIVLFADSLSAREGISLDEAVQDARRRGGRVISAETQERDGKRVHHIRLLTQDGKVQRLRIDGDSGQRMKGRPRR